jgi:PAS domain S-box-containing protein
MSRPVAVGPDVKAVAQASRRPSAERFVWFAVAIGVLALAAGIWAAALVVRSDHEADPIATAALILLTGWSFIATGLIAWVRRPDNRVGRLMVTIGFLAFLGSLAHANASLPFTLGVVLGNASVAAFAHLLLAFPSGRLGSRALRTLAGALYVDLIGLQVLWILFADFRETGCEDCVAGGVHEPALLAENAFLVHQSDRLADAVENAQNGVGIALALAVAAVLVHRFRTASIPARRALAPVLLSGGAAVVLFLLVLATFLVWEGVAPAVRWLALAAYASVPLAFLIGVMRGRLARSAIGSLVIELGDATRPDDLRTMLSRTLGDPSLELAYRRADGRFVDLDGRPAQLPGPGEPRVATMIERDDRAVAALVHDRSVLEDPELVEAATAAAGLALENERLQAELRARLDELGRERDFLETVANVTPSFLCVVDTDGRIVRLNRAFEQATGHVDGPAVRGRFFWDVFAAPEDRESVRERVTERDADDAIVEHENVWATRDGRLMSVAWWRAPLLDEEGRARYLVCGVDISERLRQQEELRRLYAEVRRRADELHASRARIVEAADFERRRLEQNIHDGAQQRLVALALRLRLAESRLDGDPAEARRLLTSASAELAGALQELSDLARGIHPAVLAERGLAPALESLAARAGLPVELAPLPEERLPNAVEAAAYYLIAEALTNAARYAHATRATVSVRRSNGMAIVRVSDDGIGGADPDRGSGLRGLVDRVEALAGRLVIDSPPGHGTTITAEIPCA